MTPAPETLLRMPVWVLRAGLVVLASYWATANIRPVPPGNQAVVLHAGAVARTQFSGLVLAWPRPLEKVVLLPGAARRMVQDVSAADSAPFLTGDGGVVDLAASVTWRIDDAAAYFVMQPHVPPALRRLFLQAALVVAARHDLDDFLAVRPERASDPRAQAARAAVRGEIVAEINRSLKKLVLAGAGLGIDCVRTDITAMLPDSAKSAFDSVLEAAQRADQGLAAARTDAARQLQQADRDRDRIFANARAAAAERVEFARATTATLTALETQAQPSSRSALLADLYRTRIAAILRQAGSVSAVDAKSVGRLILPEPAP